MLCSAAISLPSQGGWIIWLQLYMFRLSHCQCFHKHHSYKYVNDFLNMTFSAQCQKWKVPYLSLTWHCVDAVTTGAAFRSSKQLRYFRKGQWKCKKKWDLHAFLRHWGIKCGGLLAPLLISDLSFGAEKTSLSVHLCLKALLVSWQDMLSQC